MSRIVKTTRFSGVKDTNTAMFDQNGRRITGARPALAAGETVAKRGVVPPARAPSTTRVTSKTRLTATVTRPKPGQRAAARAVTPVDEDDYEVDPEEVNAAVRHAERARAEAAERAGRTPAARSARAPARTPARRPGARAKTPGKKPDDVYMDDLFARHHDRLVQQTDDFHHTYWPLCKDKVLLEAYPGFRFGLPVPEYDDLLGVGGYKMLLRDFEDAEAAAKNKAGTGGKIGAKTGMTKAQKEKAERDAKVAAKRVSLKPPPRKTAPKPKTPGPPPRPPPVARGPPPRYRGPAYIGPEEPQAGRQATPRRSPQRAHQRSPRGSPQRPATGSQTEIAVETETEVVVEDDMQTRIYKLKKKAFEKGVYDRAPSPPSSRRPARREEMALREGTPTRQAQGDLFATPLTPVDVMSEGGGGGRTILVPTTVAQADHNTMVVVRRGTNVATVVEDDVDKCDVMHRDDMLWEFDPFHTEKRKDVVPENLVDEVIKGRERVKKLREASTLCNYKLQELMDFGIFDDSL